MKGEPFAVLLERHAPKRDFMGWFAAFSKPKGLNLADWTELVAPVACAVEDLGWMTEFDRDIVKSCIVDFVLQAFTELRSGSERWSGAVPEALKGFMLWIESLSDYTVVRFCWDLLAYDRGFTPAPVWWLKRSGRLAGANSHDHLDLAVSLADEADAMCWRPKERWAVVVWERDSPCYIELLNHTSYLVRAAAAKALGQLFFGVQTKAQGGRAPRLRDILAMIQDREAKNSGIAGPFLHGAKWSVEPEEWSLFGGDFEMRAWFIETLKKSGREAPVPHIQSLEFYAHELFAFDGSAILEFLKMGRNKLAVMTATEEPTAIPELLAVLNEMAESDDPAVSGAIREYLAVRSHHAGLHYFDEDGGGVWTGAL